MTDWVNDLEHRTAFWQRLLRHIGTPYSPWKVAFFEEWARHEDTGAYYNPLATTFPGGPIEDGHEYEDPDNPAWNDNGGNPVRNYKDEISGAAATALTLGNGRYTELEYAIRNTGFEFGGRHHEKVYEELTVWGTTGFANAIREGWEPMDFRFTAPPIEGSVITGRWKEIYSGTPPYEHGGLDWKGDLDDAIRWWGNKSAPVRWRSGTGGPPSGPPYGDGTFGVCAIVGPVDGLWFVFAHMAEDSYESDSSPLKMADPGDLLGWVGTTGLTTGPHLHIGASKETVPPGSLPGFAPMRQMQGGVNRITNPDLLDPTPFFQAAPTPPPSPLTWEDVLEGAFGTPERLQELLNGGYADLEERVDQLERNGDQPARAQIAAIRNHLRLTP